MIEQAIEVEEEFLPRLGYLMDQQIKTYRLSSEKEAEAIELLQLLKDQSFNHYNLLKKAINEIEEGNKNEF